MAFQGVVSGASIVGGAGNDSVTFNNKWSGTTAGIGASNTYFFGSNTGNDTISFATTTAPLSFTIAIDSSYGTTATAVTWTQLSSMVQIGGVGANSGSILIAGNTQATFAKMGITFTTVSSSVITDLG